MRMLTIAAAAMLAAGAAQAQTRPATNNQGQQNAVSNQQANDPLNGDGGGSLLGAAALNASTAQNATTVTTQASTTPGVSLGYGVDTSSSAVGIAQILAADKAETPAPPAAEAKKKP